MTTELAQLNTPISAGEDDLRQLLHEIREVPMLNAQQERELAEQCAHGDEDAIRKMVSANLRLVVSVAKAARVVALLVGVCHFKKVKVCF